MPEFDKVKVYLYNELITATANFNNSNKIGQGGFGSVYKVNFFLCILLKI
jgi:hypothetical protein